MVMQRARQTVSPTARDERWALARVLIEKALSRPHPDPEVAAIILTAELRHLVEGGR